MKVPEWAEDIEAAGGMGNTVLYRMAHQYPDHSCSSIVADKMLVIGRVYSAAVTRGAGQEKQGLHIDDRLYPYLARRMVAVREQLDSHILSCKQLDRVNLTNVDMVIETHSFLEHILVDGIKDWRLTHSAPSEGTEKALKAGEIKKFVH